MVAKWKIISEKDVSPSHWFPVMQHCVELGNGKQVDDYFVSPIGNVAMILPFTAQNEMVFVKQYKHGLREILIELPGGLQQKGKSVEQSAIAELEEETGIKISLKQLEPLGRICVNPTKTNQVTYGFLARDLGFNSVQRPDATEEIELLLLKPAKVLEMIRSGEIWTADTVALILMAKLHLPDLFLTSHPG